MTGRKAPRPLQFTAGGDELRWQSDESGHWLKWVAVERMFVTPVAVCFLTGSMTMFVPTTAFESEEAFKAFLKAALARLPEPVRELSLANKSVRNLLDPR